MKVMVSESNLGIRSDLYMAGISDGSEMIGEAFYVSLSLPNGRNFHHRSIFLSYERDATEDGEVFFRSILEQAKASAERLLARMLAKGEVDLDCGYWFEGFASYGSECYSEDDTIAWEQERDIGYHPSNYL